MSPNTKNTFFLLAMLALITLISVGRSPVYAVDNTYSLSRFPLQDGTAIKYSQDMHGSANNGFDFATTNGQQGNVYTADSGIIVEAAETCIEIRRLDGLHHGYQHIDPADVAYWSNKIDDYVPAGQYLGRTTTEPGCGGNSDGHHLHFYVFDEATKNNPLEFIPIGVKLAGWEIVAELDSNEGSPASGNHPKLGYDYVLKNRNEIICAEETIQNGQNICTGNEFSYSYQEMILSFENQNSQECLTGQNDTDHFVTKPCVPLYKTQQFIPESGLGVTSTFRKNGSNMCLRASGHADLSPIMQETCHSNWPSYKWNIEVIQVGLPGSATLVKLVNENTGLCATDILANDDVVLRPCNNWATQLWEMTIR